MLVDKVWLLNLIVHQIVLLLSRLVDIVAECCFRPVVVVVPNVAILRFVDIIGVHWLENTFIVIIKVVVIGIIVFQKLVLRQQLVLIDNGFIVLASFVKEGVKGHNTRIHGLLLTRDFLPLLLLLLPLLRRQLTLPVRVSTTSTLAINVSSWPGCSLLLEMLLFTARHHCCGGSHHGGTAVRLSHVRQDISTCSLWHHTWNSCWPNHHSRHHRHGSIAWLWLARGDIRAVVHANERREGRRDLLA